MPEKGVFWEGISEGMAQKLEKLVANIPLLGDYLRRENARERDKIIREHIAQRIDHLKVVVMKQMEAMTEKRILTGLDKLDRLSRRLDKLRGHDQVHLARLFGGVRTGQDPRYGA